MTEIEEQFVAKALQWTADRVKYRHRGITRAGCDCTGLLIGIARECGYLKNYELRDYGRQWNTHAKTAGNQMIDELEKFADEVPKSETGPGKIVVMRFKLCPAHVGIIVNDNLLMVQIHAKAKYCKATPLRNSPWSARWIATYELNETKMKNYV
jgi:cell wall-associated NlpC family hydrolase